MSRLSQNFQRQMAVKDIGRRSIKGQASLPGQELLETVFSLALVFFLRFGIFGSPKAFFHLHKVVKPAVRAFIKESDRFTLTEFQKLSQAFSKLCTLFEQLILS